MRNQTLTYYYKSLKKIPNVIVDSSIGYDAASAL